jgi:hypothetical protein
MRRIARPRRRRSGGCSAIAGFLPEKTEIGFMDERRGFQRMLVVFLGHLHGGEFPQFVKHERITARRLGVVG